MCLPSLEATAACLATAKADGQNGLLHQRKGQVPGAVNARAHLAQTGAYGD